MRHDMSKVLVERPRSGSRARAQGQTPPRARRELDCEAHEYLPKQEGIAKQNGGTKRFSDHLGPLRRFLRRRVGRRWDAVHAEIAAVVRARTTVLQHIMDHVADDVALHVEFDERGRPLRAVYRGGRLWPLRGGDFYVDRHGFLRRVPDVSRPRRRFATATEEFLRLMNERILGGCRLELRDGVLERVHADPLSGAWTVRNLATEKHAERDFAAIARGSGAAELARHLAATRHLRGRYADRLRELLA